MEPRLSGSKTRRNSRDEGFTLIELLVTVVVLAILASISLKVIDAKEAAYIAVMKSNLRTLTLAETIYYDENYKYAPAISQLEVNIAPNVQLLLLGGPSGYTARAMHQLVGSQWCAVFMGDPSPAAIYRPATDEGVIVCGPKGGGGGGGGGSGGGPKSKG